MSETGREKTVVVTPWVTERELEAFASAWGINPARPPDWVVLQQDRTRAGCGATKNAGVVEATRRGAEVVVVLDGDCYPNTRPGGVTTLEELAAAHVAALEPQPVRMFQTVTRPPSRGTPYSELDVVTPVAASMGFWTEVGDYCAARQLAHGGAAPEAMSCDVGAVVHGRYFPLCGMNLAFRPGDWQPWCRFIDVARFDDIWMGWLWQREAYRRGCCFNLGGPIVRHSRQSNVWRNLADEALYLERSETLWRDIATHPSGDYEILSRLLPTWSQTNQDDEL